MHTENVKRIEDFVAFVDPELSSIPLIKKHHPFDHSFYLLPHHVLGFEMLGSESHCSYTKKHLEISSFVVYDEVFSSHSYRNVVPEFRIKEFLRRLRSFRHA